MACVTPHAGVWIETPLMFIFLFTRYFVTPHAGVWIETVYCCALTRPPQVTPHAGVWIETVDGSLTNSVFFSSLPMRECGLKHHGCPANAQHCWSLPMRECGLKLAAFRNAVISLGSLPMRECGLKHFKAGDDTTHVQVHSPCGSVD